jgi:hypothetical protein
MAYYCFLIEIYSFKMSNIGVNSINFEFKSMCMLSERDLVDLKNRGIRVEDVYQQVEFFRNGFPWMNLEKSAVIGDGILKLSESEVGHWVNQFDILKANLQIVKMVPASGAATRMFKSLFEHISEGKSNKESDLFLSRLHEFAFSKALLSLCPSQDSNEIIKTLLGEKGLDYGSLPKGLLAFHSYEDGSRTPLEEHLFEAAEYASDGKKARLHFTVSPEHRVRFLNLVGELMPKLESTFGINFEVQFSEQKPATDTVAVQLDNELFREKDGNMLFRPAGHGALLENLNEIKADLIFIKNIDNVVPDIKRESTIRYKKAIGGLLLSITEKIKDYLLRLQGEISEGLIMEILAFTNSHLGIKMSNEFSHLSNEEKIDGLKNILHRPTRICGVVKNMGEPGGGPFWCSDGQGNFALQLVESAQVDMENETQKEIFSNSTHFNPVDLVCSTRDYEGKYFNLLGFRDMSTGFITEKTKDGRKLKAQELPGLWNGAMAHWNTIFVEVPLDTFNPVKTVTDLLRPAHQND